MNYKTLIFGIAVVLMAVLVLPAAACPPQEPACPPGEVWGITGQDCQQVYVPPVYGNCQNCPSHTEQVCDHYRSVPRWEAEGYHSSSDCKNLGHSSSWCNAVDHQVCNHYDTETVYDCNYNDNFVKDNCGNHRGKPLITPGHLEEQCTPTYGCIAVSCPAIPCGEGYQCTDGQCILIPPTQEPTCPEVACDAGTHCVENQCVTDICSIDFQCDAGQECGPDNTCVSIPEQSRGPAYFSNPYWDQIGGCDRALNAPTGSLPTTGNGDIVVKAISCIIDEHGGKYGCVPLDGMKLFYRGNDDGVFLPTCAKRCYFGGCDSVAVMGGYPLTATAKNPQEKLRAVICKPYGDTYDVFTTQVTFEKPGMETVTMSTKDSCFDQTLGIGAYCGGCRASQALAAIFNPAWIAPVDSSCWATCSG